MELIVDKTPQIRVTLSSELLEHLRKEAAKRHVPLRWLVAGLVYDTLETRIQKASNCQPARTAS